EAVAGEADQQCTPAGEAALHAWSGNRARMASSSMRIRRESESSATKSPMRGALRKTRSLLALRESREVQFCAMTRYWPCLTLAFNSQLRQSGMNVERTGRTQARCGPART